MTSEKGGVAFTFDLDVTCYKSEMQKILRVAEKLKAYEDAEEQGLLLRLPCKVGETVYLADRIHYKVKKSIVEHVEYIKNDNSNFPFTKIKGEGFSVFFDDFGKLLFLTEEEAEKELERLNGNGEKL